MEKKKQFNPHFRLPAQGQGLRGGFRFRSPFRFPCWWLGLPIGRQFQYWINSGFYKFLGERFGEKIIREFESLWNSKL